MSTLNQVMVSSNYQIQKTLRRSLLKQAANSLANQIEAFVKKEEEDFRKRMAEPGKVQHGQDGRIFAAQIAQKYREEFTGIAYAIVEAIEDELNLPYDEQRIRRFDVGKGYEDDSPGRIGSVAYTLRELAGQINTPDFSWNA